MDTLLDGRPVLSVLIFTPLVGALILGVMRTLNRGDEERMLANNARLLALFITVFVFIGSVIVALGFDEAVSGFQFIELQENWLAQGIDYSLGVDGMSIVFILLTTFLMPLCILASWESIKTRVVEYMAAFLVLESLLIGVFCATDLVLFYIFFEAGLIPMFLIIGIWGGANKIYAAFKFFLYTLLGSLLMLVAIIAIYLDAQTTNLLTPPGGSRVGLLDHEFAQGLQTWLWLGFFASFAVKMPMWPVHTWLPDAHVEAPTAGSVILAGVLLKLGGYGFIRFSLPLFPDATTFFTPLVMALSVIAIVYASLVAFRQTDMKKLIAYSSVAHMGFVTLGIVAANEQGVQGAVFQMLSHGVISSALFLCVGVVYDRMHTREIAFYGGLVSRMPAYAIVFLIFVMGNVGLPGTSGFVGEFLTMTGAFGVATWAAFGAAFGVILSAVYMLTLYRRVVFGEMQNEKLSAIGDLTVRERLVFAPLVAATLILGIYPAVALTVTEPAVAAVLAQMG